MHRVPLVWIILIAVLAAPGASAAQDDFAARALEYRDALASLPELQNADGGWGRPVLPANATTHATTSDTASLLETVFTVDLLITEQTDPYAITRNWEDVPTSLAASNESSALDWLRDHEAGAGDTLTAGERALVAIAYHELGDTGNARRVLATELEHSRDDAWSSADAGMLVFAHAYVPVQYNETQNATLASLQERLDAASPTTMSGLSWALIAQSDATERSTQLADAVATPADHDAETLALAAWALATASAFDEADAILSELHQRSLGGLAHIYMLQAELAAHPEFSPHAPELPLVQEGTTAISRTGANPGITATPDPPAEPSGTAPAADSDGTRFPLPVWLMTTIILVAISALIVVGLAYGLKREDLQGARREIFTYIEKNPGAHFSKIRRDLGYAPGTFQHHLSVLESEGWITSHKESRYKRYFVNGNRYQKLIAGYTYKQRFAALANETTRSFVTYLKDHPGATQKQVAARLNIHASTVNWHAKRLQQAGILEPRRVGKEVQYHVDPREVDKMLDADGVTAAVAPIPA